MIRTKMEKYFLRNYFGGCVRKYKQQYKLFALKIDVSCDYIKQDSRRSFFKEQSLHSCIETFGLGYVIEDDENNITAITLDKEKGRLLQFLDQAPNKYVSYKEVTDNYNREIMHDGFVVI